MSSSVKHEYDRLASIYDRRWGSYTEATLRATLEGLNFRPGEWILDLAAGTGELSLRVAERRPDTNLVGLDLSREMLIRAKNKSGLRSFATVQGDSTRLPFVDEGFDRVVCCNSFHYFPCPQTALREIRRVLRPGGCLTITDWCDDYFSCKLCSLYLRWTDRAFQRTYSLSECFNLLNDSGFRVVAHRRFKIDRLWGLMRFDAL